MPRVLRARQRFVIPLLFVIPFVALPLQFALDYAGLGQPYPALVMPGFEGRRTNGDGTVDATTVDVEVGFPGSDATVHTTLGALIAPMPSSMVNAVYSNMFRPRPVQTRQVTGVKAWLERVAPFRRLKRERYDTGNPPSPQTVQWLRGRLARMYPGRQPAWIAFHQYRDRYRFLNTSAERVEHVRTESYRVALMP